ncbi:type I polyketide synthase [Amycolatopsis sp. QT-25]|uniref:type I polyketide synthase n=1 Tax=Amycolatopsis sp. QT-25 TaxID=3034022 RepID=UPI0023EA7C83|nr:type I polyketide synthase [Amycolatopsis sp. QT-25]WET83089.1 type I polyketide synthase [Amycolatopsis sp. QT-25]
MTPHRIAVVGIGLCYPDAGSPAELWENVLAGRRAFRRIPNERLNLDDYYAPDSSAPDRMYSTKAAVLRDFHFDRVKYRVSGSTYRATDMTHWLALEVAARALADAGFPDGDGLPHQTTGVVLGNSLGGEFARAGIMRLRWPYVRRTLASALADRNWQPDDAAEFLQELEERYKAPFPPVNEDSLAGGLANTIAGRICNHFDLRGGGYTVDGACSSSLLSVATAARALSDGELDVVLAGGVDLSIDPFETIGFAKTGALATGEMKLYDRDSNGFWPGEGSGQLVLMREQNAMDRGMRVYATITGWGVSSDGRGSITRPEADGHALALSRAYARAGYGVESVSYFEGHGTGTALGDATEIAALSAARRNQGPSRKAALSSIKGNFGHTKAAAGIAGLIKACLSIHHQVIPPGTGQADPHPGLLGDTAALFVPSEPLPWPSEEDVRAGVSAMGFGGINTHIAIEQVRGGLRRAEIDARIMSAAAGRQDAEVLLFDAHDPATLRARVARVHAMAGKLAAAELADVAFTLAGELTGGRCRGVVVAGTPEDAEQRLAALLDLIDAGETRAFQPREGVFLGTAAAVPHIAYLFPGQGSGKGTTGALPRRFPDAAEPFAATTAGSPLAGRPATEVVQPRTVAASVLALRVLRGLGIEAQTATGHSLGELSALHWAGALDAHQVVGLAAVRGEVMAIASRDDGAMASIAAGRAATERLLPGDEVVIAGFNGPGQTVVSGRRDAVERVCARAVESGIAATTVNVSHAFHSPLMAPAAEAFHHKLDGFAFARPNRKLVSTVTGDVVDPDTDLRRLLRKQVVEPVRFHEAAVKVCADADLVLELGPGRVLGNLAAEIVPDKPVLSLDTDSTSLRPLLRAIGAAFVLGAELNVEALFSGRVVRRFPLDGGFTFLANPCEQVPESATGRVVVTDDAVPEPVDTATRGESSTLDVLRKQVAERVELPLELIGPDTRPLDELHLSSITVGQVVNDVTRELGRPALSATTSYATVSLGELAALIDQLAGTAQGDDAVAGEVPGVAPWVRVFQVGHIARDTPVPAAAGRPGIWKVYATEGHPLAKPLRDALEAAGLGDGVLLCLPAETDESSLELALRAAQATPADTRFVVVQHDATASGLARTLFLEAVSVPTTVVVLAEPSIAPEAAIRLVTAEVAATTGYSEARYAADGTRAVPELTVTRLSADGSHPLSSDDVMLVTGGGKGITAECALAIAEDSGVGLALLGRADPAEDAELAANLERMDHAGIRYRYLRADVSSPPEVDAAVRRSRAELGEVTAILHGAGQNVPKAIRSLTPEDLQATLAPKVAGLRNVLDAVDEDRIKLLVSFGSIIGRAGLRGEAHYATANDWMSELTAEFGRRHPRAHALAVEWSVWSGAGMGERLGVVEALMREGITPIAAEQGVAVLRQMLRDPAAGPVLVVSGRTGGLPTLPIPRHQLPLRRFTERLLVHYPGIELVAEADLTAGSDPYLTDHLLDGDLLFPAVVGMEAMAQAAAAVSGQVGTPTLEDLRFLRPIVVRRGGSTTIRIAALVRDPETVELVIRSEETGFGADHFRATVRYPRPRLNGGADPLDLPLVPADPTTEFYGPVMFQGKRFQRVLGYRRAAARHAVAEVAVRPGESWFAPYLPQELVLPDPGARDAVMHALQCCVPDATLLPEGVDRLYLADPGAHDRVVLDAYERFQGGDTYTYDIDVRDVRGTVIERWTGLRLRAVRRRERTGPWSPALTGAHLERSLERVLGGRRAVVLEPGPAVVDRRARTALALSRALGRPARIRYRPDGRPETDGALVSTSHSGELTLAVAGAEPLACDVETVLDRTDQDWAGLLGSDGLAVRDLLARESGELAAVASTRVWGAVECLRKNGVADPKVTVEATLPHGWTVLSGGDARIATWVTTILGVERPVVFAVLTERTR